MYKGCPKIANTNGVCRESKTLEDETSVTKSSNNLHTDYVRKSNFV